MGTVVSSFLLNLEIDQFAAFPRSWELKGFVLIDAIAGQVPC